MNIKSFRLLTMMSVLVLAGMPAITYSQARRAQRRTATPRVPLPPPSPSTPVSSQPVFEPAPEASAVQPATAPSAPASATAAASASAGTDPQQPQAPPGNGKDNNEIIPAPTLMSYNEVKDNFGRRIADTYVVVQVTIKNPDIEHQFLLQDLRVVFDPNECDKAGEFYKHFDIQACRDRYDKYLKYPIAYAPTSQSALQAVAGIGQYQNPRNFGFRLLDFAATMGGALTGFNFVGRDGKAGLSVFNGTFLAASKTLLPDLTVGQLTQLTENSYKPNTLVETKDTKTYCVFISSNQLFSKETWKLYKQKTRDGSPEALELRRVLQLVLTVTASGIHIQQAPGGEDQPVTRGGAPRAAATPTPTPAAAPAQ